MRSFLLTFWLCGSAAGLFAQVPAAPGSPLLRNWLHSVSRDSLAHSIDRLVSFGTRSSFSTRQDPERGIGAAERWVYGCFQRYSAAGGGRLQVRMERWTQAPEGTITRPLAMANVLALLPGSDPKDPRLLVVGAHLDSRCSDIQDSTHAAPGANDDGSGVAAVLELARVLSRERLHESILFCVFSGEEQGLFGSRQLARLARDSSWQIRAMLNNDMIGQSTASGTGVRDNTHVRVFSEGIPVAETPSQARLRRILAADNDSPGRELARYVSQMALSYVPGLKVRLIYREDRFLRGGDQYSFSAEGFAAVRLSDAVENYTHQHQDVRRVKGVLYGDLPRFMDFNYLTENTRLNLATLGSLALAPSRPRAVYLQLKGLDNFSTLSWEPPRYGRAVAYRVYVRASDSPDWQQAYECRTTSLRLPFSKDNVYFAVQALGAGGTGSLMVFPSLAPKTP